VPTSTANMDSPSEPTDGTSDQGAQNPAVALDTNKVAVVAEQLRAAEVEKQLDEIEKLRDEADGENNVKVIIPGMIAKLAHPEAEVRKGALEALKHLNDTNAVPALEKAVATIQDLREKVAVLDTIEFLKLPSAFPDLPPDAPKTQ
jgi:hypothetical protein